MSGKFGWQSKSPNGGVSSPLYRQTPSGAKICDRSYYEPMANVDYMDARTRVAYENETVNRRFEQGVNLANAEFDLEARHFAEGYSDVLPTTSPLPSNLRSNLPATRIGARMKARTSRIRWSLASFWNRFSPKRRAAENAEPVALAQTGSWNGVELAGFEGDPTLGGAIEQTGYWQGDFAAPYGEFAPGTDNCGVPACAPQTCAPQTCDAPNCAAPGCDGAASNGGTTGGEGYRPQTVGAYPAKRQENASGFGSLGAYRGAEPKPLDFELSGDDAEQIEELPSSIMRPLSSAGSYSPSASTGSAFEDDGVPMQFVPPSRF